KTLALRLLEAFRRTQSPDWPWFEDRLTYSNARLSQALLVSAAWMEHEEMLAAGTRSLAWLATIQCSEDGYFAPIGSNGFYRRGAAKALYDQQPLEACGMVSACLEAGRLTGETRWTEHARRAFGWFFGQNHLQQSLYDAATGGCRVGDRRGHSHLCAARSANGVDGWIIDPEPTLRADPEHYPEELWGIEDPRITFVEELGKFVIAYTAFSRGGPGVALALTEDFRRFERYGLIMQPDDKDAALLPRRIDGSFALLHRPMTDSGAHIWISFSPDLRNWGGHKLLLQARKGGWWDANKVGLSPPLIETPRGWLMLYHGVRQTAAG